METIGGKNKYSFFLLIAVVITIAILAVIFFLQSRTNNNLINTENQRLTSAQLEKNYENNLPQILEPYFAKQNFDLVLDQLLKMTVPAKYRELHLNLVIGFDLIRSGQQNSDQAQIEEGLSKIENIISQYSWLEQT